VKYTGSCHCGDVAFEAAGDIKDFCERCGIHPFELAKFPRRQFNGRAL